MQNSRNYQNELNKYLSSARRESVLALESVSSTNDELKKLALSGAPDGQVVVSAHQSAGRGRLGREFFSPSGKGVYLSYLLRLDAPICNSAAVTSGAALAVCDAIKELYPCADPKLKWVNDIIIQDKKVCGILCEAICDGNENRVSAIIGIGLNVNEDEGDFPQEIKGQATSLFLATGERKAIGEVASEIIAQLDKLASKLRSRDAEARSLLLSRYRALCVTVGKKVRVIGANEEKTAYSICVCDDYSLLVRYDDDGSEEKIFSGDVAVRGLCGYV